jgi:hypothetical protein
MRILLDTSLLVTVATVDIAHFKALGVRAVNPLK